jgi:hypothetical protein
LCHCFITHIDAFLRKKYVMRYLSAIIFMLSSFCAAAQNTGIGTSTPASKLSVSGSENTVNGLNTAIQLSNTAPGGTNWYLRSGATGTATPPGGFSLGDQSAYHLGINSDGYFGFETLNPKERLHLASGNLRMDFSDKGVMLNGFDRPFITRAFDTFTTGLYSGLGRWGFFMEPSRLTMGIPNIIGKAWEVAKYEPNGNRSSLFGVDVNGALQLSGDVGSAGQVLTSNGAGAATWETTNKAYDNNIRFCTTVADGPAAFDYYVFSTAAKYNLTPSAAVITASGITLNTAGLYHFDVHVRSSVLYSSAPTLRPEFELSFFPYTLPLVEAYILEGSTNGAVSNFFFGHKNISFDVYLPAGSLVRLRHSFPTGAAAYDSFGFISGYLLHP